MNREDFIYEEIMIKIHQIKQKQSLLKLCKELIFLPFEILFKILPLRYRYTALCAIILGTIISMSNNYKSIESKQFNSRSDNLIYYPAYSSNFINN